MICVALVYVNYSSYIRNFFLLLFTFLFSVLEIVFLATFLLATSLKFFKITRTAFNSLTSKSFAFVFKLSKLVGALANLLMYNVST